MTNSAGRLRKGVSRQITSSPLLKLAICTSPLPSVCCSENGLLGAQLGPSASRFYVD
jgi:hypothetical protein